MTDVPRSTEATSGVAASYAARRRKALPSGMWGMALLIATEATFFGSMIATYFYLRFQDPQWPPAGVERPKLFLPLLLTGILVTTSVPMLLARRASVSARAPRCALLILAALVVQAGYFGMQMHLFVHDLHKFAPTESAYGSIYFTMIGVHHAHVAVGMALNAWLVSRLPRGLTNYRLIAVRAIGWYWHFVNVAAVAVVLTQLYPSL